MSLLIPEHDADPYSETRDDRLTVLTMAGLTLPKDGVGREHWTDAEALGVELLNLAAWLTQRSIYERPKDMRKGVWIDEAFFLAEVPTGRVLMNRFARDSRKWNVRVLLSSQIPADFLRIQGFVALLDSVFVGRLDDDDAQADALRLLKVPVGAGYEQVVASLGRRPGGERGQTERDRSPRQFIFGDVPVAWNASGSTSPAATWTTCATCWTPRRARRGTSCGRRCPRCRRTCCPSRPAAGGTRSPISTTSSPPSWRSASPTTWPTISCRRGPTRRRSPTAPAGPGGDQVNHTATSRDEGCP